jgi:hypothetical protein
MARAKSVCGFRPLPSFLCLNAASFCVAGESMASEGEMYVSATAFASLFREWSVRKALPMGGGLWESSYFPGAVEGWRFSLSRNWLAILRAVSCLTGR